MRETLLALFCVGIDAFSVPGQPPSARAACLRAPAPVMLDGDIVVGVGLLFGGAALGAGVIAFVEKQGERTNERGGVSDETRSRMAGKFMEDEVLVTNYGDKIEQMEAAIAEAEGREVVKGDGLTAKEKDALRISDGWDD